MALVNVNDSIIVQGGRNQLGTFLSSAERYIPASNVWGSTGPGSTTPRYGHTMYVLANDYVLAVGGQNNDVCTASVSKWSPVLFAWAAVANLPTGSCFHAGAKLGNGHIVVSGGRSTPTVGSLFDSYVYDPVANSWAGSYQMQHARHRHSVALYPQGAAFNVLASGGFYDFLGGFVRDSAEYFTP